MFHSVGLENHDWVWSYISESVSLFESKVSLLRKKGFNTVFWSDVYDYMSGAKELPCNSILLTFDDGYLDNWVYVFPILKKYGLKSTIFVSPDFVDPSLELRPNLEDVRSGNCSPDSLQEAGFLNWAEMREMEKSGLVDIQSHAMSHTWYFSGPKIQTYHRPHATTPYPWLFWNARPDRKPFYLNEDQQELVPWGHPIFENQKSLAAKRFFPDTDKVRSIIEYVRDKNGKAFFEASDWRRQLRDFVTQINGSEQVAGTYESDAQRTQRLVDEIAGSKRIIQQRLEKDVDFICWPGGANDQEVVDIARASGYKSWTLSSTSQLAKRNVPGADPSTIKRIGTSNRIRVGNRDCGYAGPYFQYLNAVAHQSSLAHAAVLKLYKLTALISSLARSK